MTVPAAAEGFPPMTEADARFDFGDGPGATTPSAGPMVSPDRARVVYDPRLCGHAVAITRNTGDRVAGGLRSELADRALPPESVVCPFSSKRICRSTRTVSSPSASSTPPAPTTSPRSACAIAAPGIWTSRCEVVWVLALKGRGTAKRTAGLPNLRRGLGQA